MTTQPVSTTTEAPADVTPESIAALDAAYRAAKPVRKTPARKATATKAAPAKDVLAQAAEAVQAAIPTTGRLGEMAAAAKSRAAAAAKAAPAKKAAAKKVTEVKAAPGGMSAAAKAAPGDALTAHFAEVFAAVEPGTFIKARTIYDTITKTFPSADERPSIHTVFARCRGTKLPEGVIGQAVPCGATKAGK